MTKFIFRRVVSTMPLFLVVTLILFLVVQILPGDPARIAAGGEQVTEEGVEIIRKKFGLDAPIPVQYLRWIGSALTGDLGVSYFTEASVSELIGRALPVTLWLALFAVVLAVMIAVPAGIIGALFAGSALDRLITGIATFGICLPEALIALLLVQYLALDRPWFPATGFVDPTREPIAGLHSLVLPGFALGASMAAELTRHLRGALIDVMQREFIRTTRASGLGAWSRIFRHGLRNAALPVVTVLGLQLRRLMAGTVVVEQIFNLNGVGTVLIQAAFAQDMMVLLGVGLVSATVVLFINLAVDISYGLLNPRVRLA